MRWTLFALGCLAAALPGGAAAAGPQPKPPWQRLLQGDDAKKAQELEQRLGSLQEAGKFEEALPVAQRLAELRERLQGADHWEAVNARQAVEAVRRALRQVKGRREEYAASFAWQRQAYGLVERARYREAQALLEKVLAARRKVLGEGHPDTAGSYNDVAYTLSAQGQYAQAQPLYEKALAIRRKVLGEGHPDTAESYNNLAYNLNVQGQYAQAQPLLEKALAIHRKTLGEEHPLTATSYNNVAANLDAQSRYAQAQPLYEKALAIWRKALGEEHPNTALSYNNVAGNLNAQGHYAQAQPLLEKALAIRRKVLGEEHPDTALSYNNLAYNLNVQGQYAQAQPLLEKALAIRRKVRGEEHPDTALSYNNVASNLGAQGQYAQAQPLLEKALAICRKVRGEEHPDTARSYNNVAYNLQAQGRYAQAQPLYKKALAICRKVRGEEHPDTATSYNSVAYNLWAQGHYAQAQPLLEKALVIRRKLLGEEHPDTANSYNNLAADLNAQGRYADAEVSWRRAADSFSKARLRVAASGLARATKTSEQSPLPALAAVLARNGKPADAWQPFEQGLGRGTWDDLSARLRRPPPEQRQQAELVARLDRIDKLIEQTLTAREPTAEQKQRREELLTQRLKAQQELTAFAHQLEQRYGPAAGQVFDRQKIQAALPADVALLGWVDLPTAGPKAADPSGEHWGVLLRRSGEPFWARLRGSGPKSTWTEADTQLPGQLREALQSSRGQWQAVAERLLHQRLGPLAKHLDGVRRLIVLPSPALAGVPVEVFAERYTVSYALSGTLYAHLRQQSPVATQGLFALGDAIFEAPALVEKPGPRPPGGVLLTMVVPGGNAAVSGLRPNDVLLRYGATDLAGPADLKPLLDNPTTDKPVAVTIWRDGATVGRQVRPGKLGVLLADKPAAQALAELRRLERRLASRSGDEGWQPLPGTRVEVQALARLFSDAPPPRLLFDSHASEQELYALARSGELGKYRYLHLATHGEVDNTLPLRSAIILSREALPDPLKQLEAGLPVFNGRLEAREVLEQWHLDADLVTLSACQSALGKYERGEGFVGFAQALILAGSRSVCLSLWKVDDTATALLMHRFYANLLGKRDGLKGPMAKAAALREAKEWLRELSRDEALRVASAVSQSVERGKGRQRLPLLPAVPEAPPEAKDRQPYAHPYYWAAFVLIGDPD
jgi:tetratricopeptide (TPR) repeat protein